MSDPAPRHALDGAMMRAIAGSHGIELDAEVGDRLARQLWPQIARLREIAEQLSADDDMLAFRRLLEQEAARA